MVVVARALACAALLLCFLQSSAQAFVVISGDDGGVIDGYIVRYREIATRGDSVQIQGVCASACTLVLGIVPSVCVGPYARLVFHSASYGRNGPYSAHGTERMWAFYPAWVRLALSRHGWSGPSKHRGLIVIGFPELASILPRC